MDIEKVSIVVPAYNEAEAIATDLEVILDTMERSRWDYEVIVVNDASTDNTTEIVRRFESRGVRLVEHGENRGGGFSRNSGIKVAKGDVVVVTDGDGTYPNEDIPKLLEKIEVEDYDMAVGARTREAGTMKILRMPAKWFIRKLASFMSGFYIPDLNSGLRAFRKDVFLRYMEILPWGHSWVSTITLAMLSGGYRVAYIDIDYHPRKGKSTFKPVSDTFNYLMLVIRTITWFNPLKVFMPLAIALGMLGFGRLIFDLVTQPHAHITPSTVVLIIAALQVFMLGLLADLIAKRR